jgi:hypothetical protein
MESHKNPPETQVTVEQLLRLKRAEKPEAEFWERFDRELHGRMLRTLVNGESKPAGWSRWLRMRWLQAGAVAACVAMVAVFALELELLDSGVAATSVAAYQADRVEVADVSTAPEIVVAVDETTTAVAVERTDFGIGRVASAKPASEASFSRDFGANAVRVAAAMPVDTYRMDYASDTVFGGQSARGRLVY